jgi:glycyl-tRNA synthetase beta chain
VPDLLLEIGTEELPPSAVRSGEKQLRAKITETLAELRLGSGHLDTFATPRRLAVLVRGVAERQDPAVTERRGPAVANAIDAEGNYTPAAVGFARANGVEPSQLVRKQTQQGEYVFAVQSLEGADATHVLPDDLAKIVASLSFPKAMRWDASRVRFPRPVRWLVALFGADVLPVRYGELEAGRSSSGHRFLSAGVVEIPDASSYERVMLATGVVPRRVQRREQVKAGAVEAAKQFDGRPVLHEAVLDEVTDLVEKPSALAGRFDRTYLDIPRDVLITAMESHQRYFAVEDGSGALLPGFVVVTNGDPSNDSIIVSGNERVLRARLEDAKFFFAEDMKIGMTARTEQLGGVVFHGKLGTMRDKVLRVGALLGRVVKWLGLPDDDADAAFFAADLCKADLLTHLVYEFPELQGALGREYALRDEEVREQAGELLPKVADAIRDHYRPRYADDELPATPAGVALGLADRLDTITGYAGLGLTPTGSEDPFALRRQAAGFAAVSVANDARIPLDDAIAGAHEEYVRQGAEVGLLGEVARAVHGLIVNRTENLLEREGVWRMFVEAARNAAWADLPDLAARARALQRLQNENTLHPLAVAFERCHNLSKAAEPGEVDPSRFVHDAEHNLWAQLEGSEDIARDMAAARDYAGTLQALVGLSQMVAALFDAVMVMDPDESLKRNRLALLQRTARVFGLVADFSGLTPKLLEEAASS